MGIAAALIGSAVIGGGAAAYSSNKASKANASATQAQTNAANDAAQVQREQLNYIRQINAPYQAMGTQALNALGAEFGFNPYQAPQPQNVLSQSAPTSIQSRQTSGGYDGYADAPGANYSGMGVGNAMRPGLAQPQLAAASPIQNNYQGFQADPGYQFRLDQGQKAIQNSLLSRGMGLSGSQLRAAQEYGQGLASQEYGNWYNRLAGMAGIGQTANNASAAYGGNAASNIGNAYLAGGNAAGQGAINSANISGNFANNIAGIAGGTLGNYNFAKEMGWL